MAIKIESIQQAAKNYANASVEEIKGKVVIKADTMIAVVKIAQCSPKANLGVSRIAWGTCDDGKAKATLHP